MKLARVGLIAIVVTGLLPGCSKSTPQKASASSQASQPADPPASQPAVVVKMTSGMSFDPSTITIQEGQTVEWRNESQVSHTVTNDPARASNPKDVSLPPGAGPFDSGSIPPGKTFSHVFTVPGAYRYVCVPHESMGMTGVVEVKSAK
jgi:plastocyanin